MTIRREIARERIPREAYLVIRARLRDLREKLDGSDDSSSQASPLAHVKLVSITIHERRATKYVTADQRLL